VGHKAIVIGIWLVLFAATLGVRYGFSGKKTPSAQENNVITSVVDQLTRIQFDSTPRRSRTLSKFAEEAQLSKYVLAHKTALLRCRDLIMPHPARPRELFEVSFRVANTSLADGTYSHVTDVMLERSSIELTSDQETCLIKAFDEFSFKEEEASLSKRVPYSVSDRVSFEMCLKPAQKS